MQKSEYHFESPTANQVVYNPDYESIWAPLQGPTHPVHHRGTFGAQGLSIGSNNTLTGFATSHFMNDAGFDQMYKTYSTIISQNPRAKSTGENETGGCFEAFLTNNLKKAIQISLLK